MASSVPAALDYLVTQTRAAVGSAAVVSDGWPAQRGDSLIAIGITPEEDDAPATRAYAELSGQEYEDVEVPCIIAVRKVGAGAASSARTAAFALFDTINTTVKSDRRLGGAVTTGMPARIVRYEMSQTAEPREAGEGRWCEIRFTVGWQHRG